MTSFHHRDAAERDNRLNAVIAEYLQKKDAGQPVDHERLLAAHPDLEAELRSWFRDEAFIERSKKSQARPPHDVSFSEMRDTIKPGAAEPDTASEFQCRTFGRYKLLRQLGEGAMGSVYLAQDTTLERLVALKIPKAAGSADVEFMARFSREAKAAAGLRHPSICSVYDIGEENGTAYITMDYIEGVPLSRFVASPQLSSLQSILILVETIADAVGHAHEQGVVHRDLKPGNIIVDKAMNPFVTDFGLARRMNSPEESRITQEGLLLGTPAYMAPEQIKGRQAEVGPASDIYSLGVMFFELLTARLPFEGSAFEIMSKSLRDDPPIPSRIRADLSEDVDDVCLKMLRKKPAERYASMAEVKSALKHLQQKLAPRNETETCDKAGALASLERYQAYIGSMLKHGKYTEALQHLKAMSTDDRPEYTGIREWARKKLPAVKKESAALTPAGVRALLATAEKLYQNHDYVGCIQLLEEIPEVRRTQETDDLLRTAEQAEIQADRLLLEIKTRERQESISGIEPTLKAFLKLKPGNKYARQLLKTLQTYEGVPLAQRKYRFVNGRLQSKSGGNFFWQRSASVTAIVLVVCGLVYSCLQISPLAMEFLSRSATKPLAEEKSTPSSGDVQQEQQQEQQQTTAGDPRPKLSGQAPQESTPVARSDHELNYEENAQLNRKLKLVNQVHAATEAQLREWARNLPENYRPYWISIRAAGADIKFDALARQSGKKGEWKLETIDGNDAAQYENVVHGFQPAMVNAYMQDGILKRMLFLTRPESQWFFYYGSKQEIGRRIQTGFSIVSSERGNSQHMIPLHMSGWYINGETRHELCQGLGPYSEGELVTEAKIEEILSLCGKNHLRGWRLHLITGIRDFPEPRFNAVFVKNGGPVGPTRKWALSPRLTIAQYREMLLKVDAMGGWPRCVTSTIEDGRAIYRVLWDGITQFQRKGIPMNSDPDSPVDMAPL